MRIVKIPADIRNIGHLGHTPETGFDGRNTLPCAFRDNRQEKFIARLEHLHHPAHRNPGRVPIDRYAPGSFGNDRDREEKSLFLIILWPVRLTILNPKKALMVSMLAV